jgi:hypothetical protein
MKPAYWIIVLAGVLLAVMGVGLPVKPRTQLRAQPIQVVVVRRRDS